MLERNTGVLRSPGVQTNVKAYSAAPGGEDSSANPAGSPPHAVLPILDDSRCHSLGGHSEAVCFRNGPRPNWNTVGIASSAPLPSAWLMLLIPSNGAGKRTPGGECGSRAQPPPPEQPQEIYCIYTRIKHGFKVPTKHSKGREKASDDDKR